MDREHTTESGRIALIAGEGDLPGQLAREARSRGVELVIYGIDGLVSPSTEPDAVFGLGEVRKLKKRMQSDNVRSVAFSGRFYRPDYGSMAWDTGGLITIAKILKTGFGGDDSISRAVSEVVDAWGLRLVGPLDIAPGLAAREGPLTRKRPTRAQTEDIDFGAEAIAGLGAFDIGQAIIVNNQRILAVEAAEGTDRMIARIGELRACGRLRGKTPNGILVKTAKPDQELRIDMPVIGADTVRAAAEAELAGIAMAAGEVLLATPDEVRAEADRAGLFVAGFPGRGRRSP